MSKKITVRTVRAQSKVEIQPDASAPIAAPAVKKGLSVAQPAGAPQGGVVMSPHLQNPFEDAENFGPPEKYAWQAILMCIATVLIIGVVVVQYLEWDTYHGGFEPVFLKIQPGMTAPMTSAAPVAAPIADEPIGDNMMEAPAEEAAEAPVE